MESFREAIWQSVPDDALPERFAARRTFLLDHLPAGARVLDAGCGDGRFAMVAVEAGAGSVVAVDVSVEAVRRARVRCDGRDDVEVRHVTEGEPLPLEEDAVDVVWAGEVLEHAVDPVGWLAEVRRVLRWGGVLLLTTPYHGRVSTVLLGLRAGAFDRHFDPRADHLRFFSARTLRGVLEDTGFADVDIRRSGGPPLARATFHVVAR